MHHIFNEPGQLCKLHCIQFSSMTGHLKLLVITALFPSSSSRWCAIACGDIKQISSSSLFEPILPAWLWGKAQATGAAPFSPTDTTSEPSRYQSPSICPSWSRPWACFGGSAGWSAPDLSSWDGISELDSHPDVYRSQHNANRTTSLQISTQPLETPLRVTPGLTPTSEQGLFIHLYLHTREPLSFIDARGISPAQNLEEDRCLTPVANKLILLPNMAALCIYEILLASQKAWGGMEK